MFRIDHASAVAALPAPQAAGTPGYFTRGNVATGVAPTIFTADFANIIQEELMAIVTAGGIAPAKSDNGQVLEALRALFAPINSVGLSFDTSGNWQRTNSDGYLEMGGILASIPSSEGTFTLNFPFEGFPTACLGVGAMVRNTASDDSGNATIQEVTLSTGSALLYVQSHTTSGFAAAGGIRWRAWGH
ncbi:hypothetical protein [Novosphingobium sp. 9]|uniref:gp53-like domain-containing protein n=1 Tax=Novosphingobium sp. 9 TaxID=2025349 RepID=UPI0021B6654A|nr:hypothetical protein [Novosphingobium sp. 9]